MDNTTTLGGPASLAFRNFEIPASLLSEVTVTLTEGERERETLAGTFRKGSGTMEEAQATATLYVPNMDWLGENILRSKWTTGTGVLGGNIIFNSDTCSATVDAGPMNIHYVCEDNDDNDVHFYNAVLKVDLELNYTASDDLAVEITLFANPDEDGNVWRLGTGDLTAESIYDVATQATVDV